MSAGGGEIGRKSGQDAQMELTVEKVHSFSVPLTGREEERGQQAVAASSLDQVPGLAYFNLSIVSFL